MRKILILCNDLEIGGIQKSLIEFLNYLVPSQDFKVDLMLWQKDGPLQKMIPQEVNMIYQSYPSTITTLLNEKETLKKIPLFFQFLKSQYFTRVLKKPWLYYSKIPKQYDIAIAFTHNGFPRYFTIDHVSASKKFLWFHHGSYHSARMEKKLDEKYFRQFDKIVTVSSANKAMLSMTFPNLKNMITVVPNIINSTEITRKAEALMEDMPHRSGWYNLVTVSRFSEEKGLDLAIQIAFELKRNGLPFKWYFIGDGDQFSAIRDLAIKMNVEDVCVFKGIKENPYPYIKRADLYIQSSYVEAHPITLIEALALKKIIVTSDIPSVRELLQNGKLGILCKLEPCIFADEIVGILGDEVQQKKLRTEIENYETSNKEACKAINLLLGIK